MLSACNQIPCSLGIPPSCLSCLFPWSHPDPADNSNSDGYVVRVCDGDEEEEEEDGAAFPGATSVQHPSGPRAAGVGGGAVEAKNAAVAAAAGREGGGKRGGGLPRNEGEEEGHDGELHVSCGGCGDIRVAAVPAWWWWELA